MTTQINLIETTTTDVPPTTGTSTDCSELDLGKFKSVDALMCAYTNLEKEFTKRSQLLREYENSNAESDYETVQKSGDNVADSVDNPTDDLLKNDLLACESNKLGDTENTNNDDCDIVSDKPSTDNIQPSSSDIVDKILQDDSIKQQLYSKLLDEVYANSLPRATGNKGQMLLTPIRKPKDIREAGRIAQELINNRRY